MSLLTDFFIATTEDMNTLRRGQPLRDLFPMLEMNNVDSSKIEMLAKLVIGNSQEHMPNEKQLDFLVLMKGVSGETSLSADECHEENLMNFDLSIEYFDPVFVACLAIVPATQVLTAATQWARQWAEFDRRPVGKDDAEDLSALMQQLCQFSKKALAEGKQLLLVTT